MAPHAGNSAKKRGRPKSINWREAERLAEKGVEAVDILAALDVPPDVRKGKEFQARLASIVEAGHGKYRAVLAARIHREAILKGKAHSLLAAARKWLKYDAPPTSEADGLTILSAVQGAGERFLAMVTRIERNREEQKGVILHGPQA